MPQITALIHTHNHARCIGRALESLWPCDQFVVVDHGATDGTAQIARQYGALIARVEDALRQIRHDWVLLLKPSEALSEALESTLYQWKQEDRGRAAAAFAVRIREETPAGWETQPSETRLLHRSLLEKHGSGASIFSAEGGPAKPLLEGDLLRFRNS